MAIREHKLGEGTIQYRGESRDYYLSKAGVWRRARWVIAGALAVIGLLFLLGSTARVTTATVTSVTAADDVGHAVASVVTSDGLTSTVSGLESTLPAVGASTTVMVLPGGRVVVGDHTDQGRIVGLAFLGGAIAMVLWARRQDRVRGTGPRITGPVDMRVGDGDHGR